MNADSVIKNLASSMGQRIADLEVQLAVTRAELQSLQNDAPAESEDS